MASLTITHERPSPFYDRFERKAELQHQTHYCPGCGHGIAHKLLAQALEDLGVQDRTVLISPRGLFGIRLLLFRCRQRTGGPWPCACGCDCREAKPPG
ncbi:MAG: hypothetical protein WDO73_22545 [Ignavibacteriota bacterium]